MRKFLALILVAFTTVACQAPVQPETPNERMVAVEYSHQAALKTAEAMYDNGTLRGETAEQVADALEGAGLAVRAAREAVKSDSDNAIALINTANQVVNRVLLKLREEQSNVE